MSRRRLAATAVAAAVRASAPLRSTPAPPLPVRALVRDPVAKRTGTSLAGFKPGPERAPPLVGRCDVNDAGKTTLVLAAAAPRPSPAPWSSVTHHRRYPGAPLPMSLLRHKCTGRDDVLNAAAAAAAATIADQAIVDALWPLRDRLPTLFAPAIGLFLRARPEPHPPSVEALPLGASRFGGVPDLPATISWPKRADGTPYDFLVQVDLAAVASAAGTDCSAATPFAGKDDRGLLPRTGWLWYFADQSGDAFCDVDSPDGKALYYWDGPATDLQRVRHPNEAGVLATELGTEYLAYPLAPHHIVTPHPDDRPLGFPADVEEAVWEFLAYADDDNIVKDALAADFLGRGTLLQLSLRRPDGEAWSAIVRKGGLQLLGHPDLIQHNVFEGIPDDVVLRFAGLPVDDAAGRHDKARFGDPTAAAERRTEWLLLLQVPDIWGVQCRDPKTGKETDAGMIGTIYVCIRRSDLAARRFDKAVTVYQCT